MAFYSACGHLDAKSGQMMLQTASVHGSAFPVEMVDAPQHRRKNQNDSHAAMIQACFEIVEMNASGILLLQEGEYRTAVERFREALSALYVLNSKCTKGDDAGAIENSTTVFKKRCYDDHNGEEKETPPMKRAKTSRSECTAEIKPPCCHLPTAQDKEYIFVNSPIVTDFEVDNEFFMLYNRGLHVIPNIVTVDELTIQELTAIVMYNIGLAHHLMGLESGNSQLLVIAIELYSAACNIYSEMSKLDSEKASLSLGFMALVNNVGHIYGHFRRFKQSSICMDELAYRLSTVTNSSSPQPFFMSEDERNIFVANVCYAENTENAPAPAA